MKPKRIFIIRHGQSTGNVDKSIYTKQPDYALNLTKVGYEQGYQAGKILHQLKCKPLAIYYSPFFRTIETLNQISKGFYNSSWSNTDTDFVDRNFIREEPRIREQEWHGKIPTVGYGEDIETERDKFGTFYYRFDGGESCADVYDRVSDFINTLNRDFQKDDFPEDTLIVTHGMTMRVFLMRFFHKTVMEFETWSNPDNCELWTLNLTNKNKYTFDFDSIKKHTPIHNYSCKLTI